MKFGKVLKTTAEEMPEMGDLFLRYKELKRQLKLIQPSDIGKQPHTAHWKARDRAESLVCLTLQRLILLVASAS